MIVKLKEIEPFNWNVEQDYELTQFFKHLTGEEVFDVASEKRPRSILFYSVTYKYPKPSSAHAWLLSIDANTFLTVHNQHIDNIASMKKKVEEVVIGSIRIDIDKGLTTPNIFLKEGVLSNPDSLHRLTGE